MFEYFKALQETGKEVSIAFALSGSIFAKLTVKEVRPDCIVVKTPQNEAVLIAMAHIAYVHLGDAHD